MIEDYINDYGIAVPDSEFIEMSSIEEIVLTIYYADFKEINIDVSNIRDIDSDKVRLLTKNGGISDETRAEVSRVISEYGLERYSAFWKYVACVRVIEDVEYEKNSYDYLANLISSFGSFHDTDNICNINYDDDDNIYMESNVFDGNKLLLVLVPKCVVYPDSTIYINGNCNYNYDVDLIAGLITKHKLTCLRNGIELIRFLGIEDPINVAIEQRLKCKSTKSSRC